MKHVHLTELPITNVVDSRAQQQNTHKETIGPAQISQTPMMFWVLYRSYSSFLNVPLEVCAVWWIPPGFDKYMKGR